MGPWVVYADGRFVTPEEATVSLGEPGFLVGDGVFATLRARRGRCFRTAAHLEGLALGRALFELDAPVTDDALGALLDDAAARTGAVDAYVRVTVSRRAEGASRLSIVARPLDVPTTAERESGVSAGVVALRRTPAACMDPTVKTTSYAAQVLAAREATRRGLSQGLQLATDDTLACAAMANVFVVQGRTLTTPPVDTGCRAGVTRAFVLEAAPSLGLAVREARVARTTLASADEVFVTSTRIGCLALASIADVGFVSKGFDVTRALHRALEAAIDAETA